MTDTDKLKRLAEAWKKWGEMPYADAILALIAENERLHMILDGKYIAVNDRAFIDAEGSE